MGFAYGSILKCALELNTVVWIKKQEIVTVSMIWKHDVFPTGARNQCSNPAKCYYWNTDFEVG